jgi:hypothetical protein
VSRSVRLVLAAGLLAVAAAPLAASANPGPIIPYSCTIGSEPFLTTSVPGVPDQNIDRPTIKCYG